MAHHGKAPQLARHLVREDVVDLPVHALQVGQGLRIFLGAGHLAAPPRLALDTAADVVGRRTSHAEPPAELAHLVDLAAQQVDDALGPRDAGRLAATPRAGLEAVEDVVVLVVAVNEQRGPGTAVQPIEEEFLLERGRIGPYQAKVAAYDQKIALPELGSLGPTLRGELADVKPSVYVARDVDRHASCPPT